MSECIVATCSMGKCGTANAANGTAVADPQKGDCQRAICDGAGNTTKAPDDADVGDDANACTIDGCSGGMATALPATMGTPCTGAGVKVCGGQTKAGVCVECVANVDCSGGKVCDVKNDAFACVDPTCVDLSKNGKETDIDCGGADCDPCANGSTCAAGTDCTTGFCDATFHCAACATDANCPTASFCDPNGKCAADLPDGSDCETDGMCTNGHCADGYCCDSACTGTCQSCSSADTGGSNGTCSDVTAGNDPSLECAGAFSCDGAGACQSCSDGVQDGAETSVDCGGACALCGTTSATAVLSCADALQKGPNAPSGVYYIKPAGVATAYQVYCDMTNSGGGWTLLLSATASGTYWGNNNPNWAAAGTTGTIPPIDASAGEYKSAAYGDLTTNTIRLCYQDGTHCHNFAHNMAQPLLSFFANGTSYVEYSSNVNLYTDTGSDTSRTTFISELGFTSEVAQNCHWLGINHKDPIGTSFAAFSAIGLMGDFNSGCANSGSLGNGTNTWLDDAAFGVGLQSCYDANSCNPGGSGHHDGTSRSVNGVDNSGDIGPWFVFGK